jgi:hypothetical protein
MVKVPFEVQTWVEERRAMGGPLSHRHAMALLQAG